jgi:uncharacterized protein YqjF (DUF2071 family)
MHSTQGIAMTAAHRIELTAHQLDQIAWGFLRSEFTEQVYADWPIDRRVDAYLLHHGLTHIVNDGSAYDALLKHVMASIGPAHRIGVLAPPRT